MLFALTFPQAQHASTFNISAERNVWLLSALRSFAIVCDYMETALFAIVYDLRSAIVCDLCDHMETSLNSQGLIRLSNNLYRRRCTKAKQIMARHLIASGRFIRVSVVHDTLPPDFSVKFLWLR